MSKVELLKLTVDKVASGTVSSITGIVPLLESRGIVENMHVGQPKEFFSTDEEIAEWYLGQYISIINQESWFAMNSLINQSGAWVESKLNSM
ncbi:hypothetical protein [Priestia megaterium]|uniref:hypothetical protein n=1 Tax=Priestia megaterium TaxID=1404 RepID=UPI00112C9286|nr:hypothetical protein [Priestia megaterium]TPF18029.1 hypothetical protein CBE78_02040 [Priestia megaterium]TPF22136.1 hypothetical protein CBE79_04545 [Priestia megaterium]